MTMTKTERVIRSIFGITQMNLQPLIVAVDVAIELVFDQKVAVDDIPVTKLLYPEVSKCLHQKTGICRKSDTVARRVERLANFCWDALKQRGLVEEYLGAPIRDIRAPRDMVFYLAFYVHLDMPYFVAIRREPTLLF